MSMERDQCKYQRIGKIAPSVKPSINRLSNQTKLLLSSGKWLTWRLLTEQAELLDVEGLDLTQRLVWKRYTFTKDLYFVPDACTIQHVISKY